VTLRNHGGGVALRSPTPLEGRLLDALRRASCSGDDGPLRALVGAEPSDPRDGLATLGLIHGLSMAPIEELAGAEQWQHHPAVADLRWRLEVSLVERLDALAAEQLPDMPDDDGAVAALRRLAHVDAVPEVYRWLAERATFDELIGFLALEGGPDGGFDDLVALCQVGLSGRPKLVLAANYWDEMGRGELEEVHTALHRRLGEALGLSGRSAEPLPEWALLRGVLGSFLALSRAHQPEAVGAFGLIELQAGPRCRWVLKALDRLDAPHDAAPFYAEHAEADPRHGKDWLDHAVAELATDPRWAEGIVRGARWRAAVGSAFFAQALVAVTGAVPDRVSDSDLDADLGAGRARAS
jgi:hypothetical protein